MVRELIMRQCLCLIFSCAVYLSATERNIHVDAFAPTTAFHPSSRRRLIIQAQGQEQVPSPKVIRLASIIDDSPPKSFLNDDTTTTTSNSDDTYNYNEYSIRKPWGCLKDEENTLHVSVPVHVSTQENRRSIILQAIVASGSMTMTMFSQPTHTYALNVPVRDEPMECSNGKIVAENAVPGAYQQICMSLPSRAIRLRSTGDVISVLQGTTNGDDSDSDSTATTSSRASAASSDNNASLSGRTGVALWNSGILLTRLLDGIGVTNRSFLENKTVLELGCGTGMASIAAHKLGAGKVIATDGNDEVVQLAKRNLERNNVNISGGGGGNDNDNDNDNDNEATMLQWGALNAIDYYQEADIVMGSDLTYNSANWGILAETFDTILKPDGMVLYLTLGHSGFAVEGELGGFLTTVQSMGSLEYIKEDGAMMERLLNASLSDDEKRVIQGTGGFKVAVFKKKKRRR